MIKFLALFPLTISSMKIFKSYLNNSFISDIDDSDERNKRKGMDERFKSPELTELYDEMNTIEINYYRKQMLDTLEHKYISDELKILLINNNYHLLQDYNIINITLGGLYDDWDFIF